jgi:hypothetical protein
MRRLRCGADALPLQAGDEEAMNGREERTLKILKAIAEVYPVEERYCEIAAKRMAQAVLL